MRTAMLTARSFTRVYRGDPGEVARVRRDLTAYLGNVPQADDAILIASELAANSVVHSGSAMFVMRCEIFRTYVWIDSQDSGADWNPRLPDDRPHGTDLIELLADEWGTERSSRRQDHVGEGGPVSIRACPADHETDLIVSPAQPLRHH